jgi:hypothetical protein
MTKDTAGLTLQEQWEATKAELALTEESGEPVSPSAETPPAPAGEQPAVETEGGGESGVLDALRTPENNDLEEQPEKKDSYEVTVNGETFKVDAEELVNGYQRQADYTRSKQELAEQRREAEKALTLLRLLEEKPVDTVRKLYQQINKGESVSALVPTTESTPVAEQPNTPQDIDALVEAKVAEVLEQHPQLQEIQQESAMQQIEGIFSEIEDAYSTQLSNADKQLVLEEATKLGTTDLKFVFGGLLHQAQQRKAALANAKGASSVTAGRAPDGSENAPKSTEKGLSFRERFAAVRAEQGDL